MSRRHRAAAPTPVPDRRDRVRRERHGVRDALGHGDPEDVVVPVLPHTVVRDRPPAPSRRRLRHWKDRSWKRRTALRRSRNEALRRLAEEE